MPRTKTVLKLIATLFILPLMAGAIGSKLGNIPWTGVRPFIRGLPSQCWIVMTWPIPVPTVVLLVLLFALWKIGSAWNRLKEAEAVRTQREAELVSLAIDSSMQGVRWKFQAQRDSPYPTISDMRRHCQQCDSLLANIDGPATPTSWMSGGSGERIICPFGHVDLLTTFTALQQDAQLASSGATHLATEYFRQLDNPKSS